MADLGLLLQAVRSKLPSAKLMALEFDVRKVTLLLVSNMLLGVGSATQRVPFPANTLHHLTRRFLIGRDVVLFLARINFRFFTPGTMPQITNKLFQALLLEFTSTWQLKLAPCDLSSMDSEASIGWSYKF